MAVGAASTLCPLTELSGCLRSFSLACLYFPLSLDSSSLALLCFHCFLLWLKLPLVPSASSQGLGMHFHFDDLQASRMQCLQIEIIVFSPSKPSFPCCLRALDGQDGNPGRAALLSASPPPGPPSAPSWFLNYSQATALVFTLIISHKLISLSASSLPPLIDTQVFLKHRSNLPSKHFLGDTNDLSTEINWRLCRVALGRGVGILWPNKIPAILAKRTLQV